MTKVSDAAKAAAVMFFVCLPDDEDYDTAVEIFNALGQSHGPIDEVLDQFEAKRWAHLETLEDGWWWETLEILAHNIDASFDHFEFEKE